MLSFPVSPTITGAGDYHFRADQFNLHFYSNKINDCTVPGCTSATVKTLGMQQNEVNQTIDYTYDPLDRLTNSAYDNGKFYTYTYDAVGNRLTETTEKTTNTYAYNNANELTNVNGTAYSWDSNGNLLSDGTRTYAYDAANHLTVVSGSGYSYHYIYNGLGDRLQSTLNGVITDYALDLNRSLTQVLSDGTNIYTYGLNRIAQMNDSSTGYFLTDALGSVRQVASDTTIPTDEAGSVIDPEIVLFRSYSPYGETISSNGDFATDYGYTGEMTDDTGLVNLRARYYDPSMGRFISADTWGGDYQDPLSLVSWSYVEENPINRADPTGNDPWWCDSEPTQAERDQCYSGWLSNWHKNNTPNINNYDPAVEPKNITWNPSMDVSLSPSIYEGTHDSQYYPKADNPDPNNLSKITRGYNSCGQLVVSMIIANYCHCNTDYYYQDIWKKGFNGNKQTTSAGDILAGALNSGLLPGWKGTSSYDWNMGPNSANVLKTMLGKKHYAIALVQIKIEGGYSRIIRDTGIGHWVLITGMSAQWEKNDNSSYNWIRINNPYNNRKEYYPWTDFKTSWSHFAFGYVELWP